MEIKEDNSIDKIEIGIKYYTDSYNKNYLLIIIIKQKFTRHLLSQVLITSKCREIIV